MANIDLQGVLSMRIRGHIGRPYVCIPEGITDLGFLRLHHVDSKALSLCEPDGDCLDRFDWKAFKKACLDFDVKDYERQIENSQRMIKILRGEA